MVTTSPKVLIVGSGAREHALAWRLKKSPQRPILFCAPGNGGTQQVAENIPIGETDIEALLDFAMKLKIDLTVVGPEAPLALGLADRFLQKGLRIVGPTQRSARLETSKVYAKAFMQKHGIPTAPFEVFTSADSAARQLEKRDYPLVIKADGLAAGKGVFVCQSPVEAYRAIRQIMVERAFGESGDRIIIESFLKGHEVSLIALTDGHSLCIFPPCQDHKAAYDGDTGPNTGGMGAYSPVPLVDHALERRIVEQILQPTLTGLAKEGSPFCGFLYVGLMIADGNPMVLEFNARLGDPETQALMLRLDEDFLALLLRAAEENLSSRKIAALSDWAVCVVGAAPGYPGSYEKHLPLDRVLLFSEKEDAVIFHAGTTWDGGNGRKRLVSTGGRVLSFCARAATLEEAQKKAYSLANGYGFERMHLRKDIGNKARTYPHPSPP